MQLILSEDLIVSIYSPFSYIATSGSHIRQLDNSASNPQVLAGFPDFEFALTSKQLLLWEHDWTASDKVANVRSYFEHTSNNPFEVLMKPMDVYDLTTYNFNCCKTNVDIVTYISLK